MFELLKILMSNFQYDIPNASVANCDIWGQHDWAHPVKITIQITLSTYFNPTFGTGIDHIGYNTIISKGPIIITLIHILVPLSVIKITRHGFTKLMIQSKLGHIKTQPTRNGIISHETLNTIGLFGNIPVKTRPFARTRTYKSGQYIASSYISVSQCFTLRIVGLIRLGASGSIVANVYSVPGVTGHSTKGSYQYTGLLHKVLAKFYVFFYGTLKKGQPNHHFMANDIANGRCDYVCGGHTVDKWPLIIASKYNIPCLLYKQGYGKQVFGELYSLDISLLEFLDYAESKVILYKRKETQIVRSDNGTICKAWVYFIMEFKPELLDRDTFDCYDTYGNHGLPFDEAHDPERDEYDPNTDIVKRFLVFVYGTLKPGQPNHYILKDPAYGVAEWVCTAETKDKWPLCNQELLNLAID
ncbi:unnamed protein product, partial [Medioppia subpectinata]